MSKTRKTAAKARSATKSARAERAAARKSRSGAVLITGASGFLGKHLVDYLSEEALASDAPLRALVRQPTLHLSKRGVEVVRGDVADPAVCARALEGVTEVYHLAGFVSRDPDDAGAMYRVHVEGTRVLLEAAAAAGVRRVVVASTSGTVGVSKNEDEIATEATPYRTSEVMRWPYYLSKIYQEQTALALGRELGLEVVVVMPSLLLGPGDDRSSSTGDVEKAVRGKLPLIPKGGGLAFVDARDAAVGCALAMRRGKPGERYLLSAVNMPLDAFLGRAARLAGVTAPRAWVAPKAMRLAGRLVEALYRRAGSEPPLDVQSLDMAEHYWYVDAAKAMRELGWAARDPQATLLDTVRDIQRRHNLDGGSVEAR